MVSRRALRHDLHRLGGHSRLLVKNACSPALNMNWWEHSKQVSNLSWKSDSRIRSFIHFSDYFPASREAGDLCSGHIHTTNFGIFNPP
jgi:hypothetical protein